jgi:predicted metal-dependent phosphoesterase TrpH
MRSPIDLHLHSSVSDGKLAPRDLVAFAASLGVRLMALTDHDTTDGLEEARASATEHGVALVAGVEVSANWRGRSIHVLGLCIDPAAAVLRAGLERTRALRRQRAQAIAARLTRQGLPGAHLLESAAASTQVITRTHFAHALVAHGIVPDPAQAYARWLGQGRPGHVRSEFCPLAEVVGWIRACGGAAVIAHPLRYRLSAGARRALMGEFKAAGGEAIEVVTGGQSAAQVEAATGFALRAGLAASAGSDFHDPGIPWNPPGRLANLPSSLQPIWMRPGFPRAAANVP